VSRGWAIAAPIIGVTIGFAIVYAFDMHFPIAYSGYIAIAALAGLDTFFGGLRAAIAGKFEGDIFATGFVFNAGFAALLVYVGDLIGIDLFIAAAVVLGGRIMINISKIRRQILGKPETSEYLGGST
jgi:small basic protein